MIARVPMRIYDSALNLRAYIPLWSLNIVSKNLDKDEKVLDVGCGGGETMSALTKRNKGLFAIGTDIYLPYLEEGKDHRTHNGYILCDIRDLPFRRKSFTTALCCHVIEHLEKQEGKKLIRDMEELASKKVIIVTPPYFSKEGPEARDEPYQIHKSGWSPEEFKRMGYKVRGHSFHGKWQLIPRSPRLLQPIIYVASVITSLLSYFLPAIGGEMVCVKPIDGSRRKR